MRRILHAASAAAALFLTVQPARADTLRDYGFYADFGYQFGTAEAQGVLTYDITTGSFITADITLDHFFSDDPDELTSIDGQMHDSFINVVNVDGLYIRYFVDPVYYALYGDFIECGYADCGPNNATSLGTGSDAIYTHDGALYTISPPYTVTPEPSSFALLGTGLLSAGAFMRRRNSAKTA